MLYKKGEAVGEDHVVPAQALPEPQLRNGHGPAHAHGPLVDLFGMNLGVTLLDGRGGFSGDEKQVVLCAFKRSQIAPIKATVTGVCT